MIKSTAIALTLIFALTLPAVAERAARDVAAALTMAEAGLQNQHPAMIIAALEAMASYDLIGSHSATARAGFLAEARFFLRGNEALGARLAAIETASEPDAPQVWIAPFQPRIRLPDTRTIRVLATSGVLLRAASGGPDKPCTPRGMAQICGFVPDDEVLRLDGTASGSGWVVIELAPAAP